MSNTIFEYTRIKFKRYSGEKFVYKYEYIFISLIS